MQTPLNPGRLWIVATPLGNAADLSPRAREILASADMVLAEDTRLAARLFRACDIPCRSCLSFFDHNEEQRLPDILESLRKGAKIALISDAGTPLLADPGFRLVAACRKENIPVSPAPGPSAPIAALSASGLPPIPFSFLGFLPRGKNDRKKLFTSFADAGTLIFFERKDRLPESLDLAFYILGKRDIAICRELTKTHEEFIFCALGSHNNSCSGLLGEITVIIGPAAAAQKTPEETVMAILQSCLDKGLKLREAVNMTKRECRGWTSKEIYALREQAGAIKF